MARSLILAKLRFSIKIWCISGVYDALTNEATAGALVGKREQIPALYDLNHSAQCNPVLLSMVEESSD
jgi:hypothetical protein